MSQARTTVFDVAGMTCGSCVRHITNAVGGLAGVLRVDVSLKDGTVCVVHDAEKAPSEGIARPPRS